MKSRKWFLGLFFIVIVCKESPALTERYFIIGGGYAKTSVLDLGQSPLLYTGAAPSVKTGFALFFPRWIHNFSIEAVYGGLKNRYSPGFYKEHPYQVIGNIGYSLNWKAIRLENEIQLAPGIIVSMNSHLRMIPKLENSIAGYEIFPALGISHMAGKEILIGKVHFSIVHSLFVPVVVYLMRSNYVSMMNYIDPHATYLGTIMESGKIASVTTLLQLSSLLDLSYTLKSGNKLTLSYRFHYNQCATINRSQTALHCILLSSMMRF